MSEEREDYEGLFIVKRHVHGLDYDTDLFARIRDMEILSAPPPFLYRIVKYTVMYWQDRPQTASEWAAFSTYQRGSDETPLFSFNAKTKMFSRQELELTCIHHFLKDVVKGEVSVHEQDLFDRLLFTQQRDRHWVLVLRNDQGEDLLETLRNVYHRARYSSTEGLPMLLESERAHFEHEGVEGTLDVAYRDEQDVLWFDKIADELKGERTLFTLSNSYAIHFSGHTGTLDYLEQW